MRKNRFIICLVIAILFSSCCVLRKEINKKNTAGKKEDIWLQLDSTQTHIILAKYKHGVLNGIYRTYHLNGNKSSVGRYRNNVPIGKWLFYFEDGFLYKKIIHNNKGEVTERALYNPINF